MTTTDQKKPVDERVRDILESIAAQLEEADRSDRPEHAITAIAFAALGLLGELVIQTGRVADGLNGIEGELDRMRDADGEFRVYVRQG